MESICSILAENSGMDPIKSLSEAKSKQISEKSHVYGIGCMNSQVEDMRALQVFETLASKKNQFSLATQVVKMILKIDDLIEQAIA